MLSMSDYTIAHPTQMFVFFKNRTHCMVFLLKCMFARGGGLFFFSCFLSLLLPLLLYPYLRLLLLLPTVNKGVKSTLKFYNSKPPRDSYTCPNLKQIAHTVVLWGPILHARFLATQELQLQCVPSWLSPPLYSVFSPLSFHFSSQFV